LHDRSRPGGHRIARNHNDQHWKEDGEIFEEPTGAPERYGLDHFGIEAGTLRLETKARERAILDKMRNHGEETIDLNAHPLAVVIFRKSQNLFHSGAAEQVGVRAVRGDDGDHISVNQEADWDRPRTVSKIKNIIRIIVDPRGNPLYLILAYLNLNVVLKDEDVLVAFFVGPLYESQVIFGDLVADLINRRVGDDVHKGMIFSTTNILGVLVNRSEDDNLGIHTNRLEMRLDAGVSIDGCLHGDDEYLVNKLPHLFYLFFSFI